jgi:heme/copper-type cytochrome/quinol oxidase subunit 3
MTTGLHAIHVIIGVIFLIISLIRIYLDHYTIEHHIGFEFAIYYWHLVDVIWLLVFFIYYWWGS